METLTVFNLGIYHFTLPLYPVQHLSWTPYTGTSVHFCLYMHFMTDDDCIGHVIVSIEVSPQEAKQMRSAVRGHSSALQM